MENVLDFSHIRRELASYCLSEDGKTHCMKHQLFFSSLLREEIQNDVIQYHTIREIQFHWPSIPPSSFILKILEKTNAILSEQELQQIAVFIFSWLHIRSILRIEKVPLHMCPGKTTQIFQEYLRQVDPLQGIKRDTDPILRKLHNQQITIRQRIIANAQQIMQKNQKAFQSKEPAFRQGRFVLPLDKNARLPVSYVILAVSEGGSTYYIEPRSLLILNNELLVLEQSLERRLYELRKQLSTHITYAQEELQSIGEGITHFDMRYARIQFYNHHKENCFLSPRGTRLYLKNAIHPLMKSSFVPLDMTIDNNRPIVIVSGANAGGKTISLKTIGILVLMHHFVLPVPVDAKSDISSFNQIFCIIGDKQSSSNGESTYSSRLLELKDMLQKADNNSLVLIDECAAHTSAEEGAALACAIIEFLLNKKAKVWLTTHIQTLKAYALTHKGIKSCVMEFDKQHITPTFRIQEGIASKSHAIELAERYGIFPHIIARAKEYLQADKTGELLNDISQVLHKLQAEQELVHKEKQLFIEEYQNKNKKHYIKQKELLEKLNREYKALREFRKEATKTLDALVAYNRQEENYVNRNANIKTFRKEINIQLAQYENLQEEFSQKTSPPISLEVGNIVRYHEHIAPIEAIDKSGNILLYIRGKRVWLKADLVTHCEAKKHDEHKTLQKPQVIYSYEVSPRTHYQSDVRGLRLQEALLVVDAQLQHAILERMKEIIIIHGKGDGILQKGICQYIHAHSLVKSYRYALPEEGGMGKLYVKVKD